MAHSGPPGPRLREARQRALTRLLPGIQLFSLVDVVLLCVYFWPVADPVFLVGWAAAMTLWCAFWLWAAAGAPRPGFWILGHAAAEAVLFSSFILVVLPSADPPRAVVLTAFVTGLLAAGGLSKMSVPPAAFAFIWPLTAGGVVALTLTDLPQAWVAEVLFLAFAAAISFLVLEMSKVFDARVRAEEDLDRQKTLVSHLLADFEESASEGLWESDARGHLTSISPRLSQLFGVPAADLTGKPLAPWTDLEPTMGRGAAFRNLILPFEVAGQRRWWALSGKPLKDGQGAVIGWRGAGSDITGERMKELELLRLSRHDNLTGLYNRLWFRRQLDELTAPGGSTERRALVLIDLVGFRDVNESRGHAFGDALLQAVAGRLRQALPETVLIARLDGDEFALLAPVDLSPDEIVAILHRILQKLATPYELLGGRLEPGFRMGLAFAPRDAVSADQWLRCADLALRAAKTGGRNQIVPFTPDLLERFRERHGLQEDMRAARDNGELSLVYQPLVDLITNQTTGFEALLRWTHPVRGPVPPETFIPLAEEDETILSLGLWVLEEACREAQAWPDEISVSVNVSGVQLRSGSLDADVGRILDRLGFDPTRLTLEITESALIQDDKTVGPTLAALKRRGLQLALDDFGTGYSALSYLQQFPFDKLKIDQSFVRSLSAPGRSRALLGSIVSLARTLGLGTTAEGVEDAEQRDVLKALGCDLGQGYLFSRPVPGSRVPRLIG